MNVSSSYRTILRSSWVMGVASALNIVSGLLKMKVVALLLGPTGVGLIGLYQSFVQAGSTVASLGFGTAGTRQIAAAEAAGGAAAVSSVRQALFWGTLVLSLTGGLLFLVASAWIASHILEAPKLSREVSWLSLGVVLTVAAGSQGALLTGLRRIGDLARIQVLSGVFGALVGSLAIWGWGAEGVVMMVLAAPLMTFAMGHFYVARLTLSKGPPVPARVIAVTWRHLAAIGIPFMLSGLITTLANLATRTIVQREMGSNDLGQFQAAWAIGMTYLSFVLTAMATDYFPRLSAVIGDRSAAARMINEQTEVALMLCGPALLAMLALAPVVIHLLYSAEFVSAVDILRWQLLGDILKVMSWPLGYVLLAAGAGRAFVLAEAIGMGIFVGAVLFGLPLIGITATGVAFVLLYAAYLPTVYLMCRRRIEFRWSTAVKCLVSALGLAAVSIAVLGRHSNLWAAAVGLAWAAFFGIYGLWRLAHMEGGSGRIGKSVAWLRSKLGG